MPSLYGDDRDWDAVDLSDKGLIGLWQELGFPTVERPGDELAEWVVVVEIALPSQGRRFDLAALEALIDVLGDRQPSALYSDDRYALQLHLKARSATDAVDSGICAHEMAAARIGFGALPLLRTEVISRGEFERSCQEQLDVSLAPTERDPISVPHEVYQATRAILGATAPGQLTDALIEFVVTVGGSVSLGSVPVDRAMVAVPIALTGRPIFGAADPYTVAGFMIEDWLPRLVADAGSMLARITADAGE